MLEDRLDDVGVVIDAELVGHRQQQRVGFGDGFVLLELFDKQGMKPVGSEPADVTRMLANDLAGWTAVIKKAGIEPK